MPPIILVLLQGLFLLLLYLFLARAVRAVVRDIRTSAAPPRPASSRAGARPAAARSAPRPAERQPASGQRGARRGEPGELVVHTPGGKPRVVPLDSEEIRFGRSQQCTVAIQDSYVSEQHARIYRTDDGWVVADMGSTNGTYLNRTKVTTPASLHPGDQLAIGKTVVEVRK